MSGHNWRRHNWRRGNRGRNGRERDDRDGADRGGPSWLTVVAILPVVLFGLASAAHRMRQEAHRPIVGDMVVFAPDTPGREMFRAVVPAIRVGQAPGTAADCRLNSAVMATVGGSLVIERRLPTDPPWFRLHWSGPRTDDGPQDCGVSARLEVSRVDLRKLATAAGGFGPARR